MGLLSMKKKEIYSAAQLTDYIHEVGFLPLLYMVSVDSLRRRW